MLRVPGKKPTDIPLLQSAPPKPEEIVILNQRLLKAVISMSSLLAGMDANWAVGGDAGEIIMGVNVDADRLEVITTSGGCEEIAKRLSKHQKIAPSLTDRRLARDAELSEGSLPVHVRSRYAEFEIEGVKVEVYGELQIRVGDWDWGDPLEFVPDFSYVVGQKVPVVPLRLKSELDLGLGWLDRVQKISDAALRRRHKHLGKFLVPLEDSNWG